MLKLILMNLFLNNANCNSFISFRGYAIIINNIYYNKFYHSFIVMNYP